MEQTGNAAPSPALVFELLNSYQKTEALRAAIELDLFSALGDEPVPVSTIAAHSQASTRGIRILCDYLSIVGLLEKRDGGYTHSKTSALFLDPRSPASIASTARFLGLPAMREPFLHLADVVKNGRTTLQGDGTVEPENPVWVEFAHSMAPMMAHAAGPLGGIVLAGRTGPMDVLDIAAGHGLFGIEVAKQNPQATVTAIDWAPVLAVARANAEKAGVGDRFSELPGSAFDVEYGGPYDIVLITNFLHHFDPSRNVELLRKVFDALKPGGGAAILEFVPNEDRVSPPLAASFSLMMLASTATGDAYTFNEYEQMCREAGFSGVSAQPVPMSPHTVVLAQKAG